MLKCSPKEQELVRCLYHRILSAKATGITAQEFLDFVKVRKLIFKVNLSRQAEFEILKLLGARMANKPCPYNPRTFIEFDFEEIPLHKRQERLNGLKTYFADLAPDTSISLSGLAHRIDEFMPAKTQQDIAFGTEALYSLLSMSLGENVMKVFKGPNQSGEVDDDNVE